jgi:predicted AlkP superfamily phosphohydrolase/phosphomutase
MKVPPLIAIGLDAADPVLLERWMDAGLLPTLAKIRAAGTYARLAAFDFCRAESACTTFLTGCAPWTTGRWTGFRYHQEDYTVDELDAYEFEDYPPFYALAQPRRIAVFDLPQTRMTPGVNGIQVLGWGAHAPHTLRMSSPDGLLAELTARHGEHPTYDRDYCALWDVASMRWMKEGLLTGISRRARICCDLLRQERWDLFITFFGETHSAGHYFYHLSQPHPLPRQPDQQGDWILDIFQAVDRALQEILATAPPDARVILFSDHGMEPNSTDLPSLVFLPELLYRWSFPGQAGMEVGSPRELPPPIMPTGNRPWAHEVWMRKHDRNPITRALRRRMPVAKFHYSVERRLGTNGVPLCPEDCPLGYQPPMWYSPAWPRMKAFALPSFSEGFIRLNVRGRDAAGVIGPDEYPATCDEIERLLREVRNARTGSPMFRKMMRSRTSALEEGSTLPDPDLLVLWTPEPADVVDTPFGRIGPIPFNRSGSHVERGFILATGPGVPVSGAVPEARAVDLAPTILSLLGVPVPSYMDGRPLFTDVRERAVDVMFGGSGRSPERHPG